jgi:hypothetical protein
MIKKLLNLLFKSKRIAASVVQPALTQKRPLPSKDNRVSINRLTAVPGNTNYRPIPSTYRNGANHAYHNSRHDFRASRHRDDSRNAAELLRDGHLRIALAGFNVSGFTISPFTRSTDLHLAGQISDLPTQVKMIPHRNVGAGLQTSLQMLSRSPQGRTGILLLTSGEPTMNSGLARALVQTAIEWETGIHIIELSNETHGRSVLASLSTRPSLGYGRFRSVTTSDELNEAVRGALDGLAPARGMLGINSAVILTDCSEKMVESFQKTTRIEMIATALQEYLRNPLLRSSEKRMALAA